MPNSKFQPPSPIFTLQQLNDKVYLSVRNRPLESNEILASPNEIPQWVQNIFKSHLNFPNVYFIPKVRSF